MRRTGMNGWLVAALAVACTGCTQEAPAATADTPTPPTEVVEPVAPPPPPREDGLHRPILTSLAAWDAATPGARRAAAEFVGKRLDDFALEGMQTFTCGTQTHEVGLFGHRATGMQFSLVPGGVFQAGSPESEPGREPEETRRRVTLTMPFLVSRTEVTQEVWGKVTGGRNPSHFKGPRRPVENVSWKDCEAFCEQTGVSFPTEAQWEYACRAGATTAYCFGDDVAQLPDYAWYKLSAIKLLESTQNVGKKKPNGFGLFDVHGNVWEWCSDWKAELSPADTIDPAGPGVTSRFRVVRGGSWHYAAAGARCAFRTGHAQRSKSKIRGFRVVKNIWLD